MQYHGYCYLIKFPNVNMIPDVNKMLNCITNKFSFVQMGLLLLAQGFVYHLQVQWTIIQVPAAQHLDPDPQPRINDESSFLGRYLEESWAVSVW